MDKLISQIKEKELTILSPLQEDMTQIDKMNKHFFLKLEYFKSLASTLLDNAGLIMND